MSAQPIPYGRIGTTREVKEMQRQLIAGMRGPWTPWDHARMPDGQCPFGAHIVHRNNYYTVLEAQRVTEWGAVAHLAIRRHDEKMTDSWKDKQRIKDTLKGAIFTAIEVFPTENDLIDEANMAHLWVLPTTTPIPFGLHIDWWKQV